MSVLGDPEANSIHKTLSECLRKDVGKGGTEKRRKEEICEMRGVGR